MWERRARVLTAEQRRDGSRVRTYISFVTRARRSGISPVTRRRRRLGVRAPAEGNLNNIYIYITYRYGSRNAVVCVCVCGV